MWQRKVRGRRSRVEIPERGSVQILEKHSRVALFLEKLNARRGRKQI